MTSPLTPAEREELALRETLAGTESLIHFVHATTPRWEPPWHLTPIADIFLRAERGPVLACSSVSPQHGKTVAIGHWLIRYMMRFPAKRNAYVSYAAERAQRVGRQMLDTARMAGLRLKVGNQNEWVTHEGGGLIFTGIGGSITGDPIDGIFVVDDGHKDRFEANSVTIRQNVIDYVTVTAAGRLHPCASILVNGTRWHVSDIQGYLREQETQTPVGWTFVNIPAISDDGKPCWPSQRPLDFLERQRRILGDYDFSAEYLGRPVPDGGEVFHAPARYSRPDCDTRDGVRILCACDPAVTAKASADYSAIVVGAMRHDPGGCHSMDVLDYKSMQVEVPTLVRELIALQKAWRSPIAIEAVGGMKSIPSVLRQIDRSLVVLEIQPRGDKLTRSRATSAAWNDARIRVPEDSAAPWVARFVRDIRSFVGVGDKHDDATDALVHCWDTLAGFAGKRPRGYSADIVSRSLPMG